MGALVTGEVVALASGEAERPRRRRRWTADQKLAIVRETETSGDPVAVVARRYGMNANHLFIWRQKAREGTLGRDERRKPAAAEPMRFIDLGVVGVPAREVIEIALPSGVVVRAPASATGEALASVLLAVKAAGL
jgi:transposase-like protein